MFIYFLSQTFIANQFNGTNIEIVEKVLILRLLKIHKVLIHIGILFILKSMVMFLFTWRTFAVKHQMKESFENQIYRTVVVKTWLFLQRNSFVTRKLFLIPFFRGKIHTIVEWYWTNEPVFIVQLIVTIKEQFFSPKLLCEKSLNNLNSKLKDLEKVVFSLQILVKGKFFYLKFEDLQKLFSFQLHRIIYWIQ